MKKSWVYLSVFVTIFMIIILFPTVLVSFSHEDKKVIDKKSDGKKIVEIESNQEDSILVSVFRTNTKTIEEIPLEEYVVGVVASEMPADFEIEALKAQGLAARTNIVRAEINGIKNGAKEVSDTTSDQVYKNEEELKAIWGADFTKKIEKIREAVSATKGQIILYNQQPISAVFFSTSNGRTENSEEYWTTALPYLKSVESSWDLQSPKYPFESTMSVSDVEKKLSIKIPNTKTVGTVKKRTSGGRIAEIEIAGQTFTGREIREKLGLRSTDFTLTRNGKEITIQTKGYGHGVGMSQYGADGLAKEGKTYSDIIRYYYQGVEISNLEKISEIALLSSKK